MLRTMRDWHLSGLRDRGGVRNVLDDILLQDAGQITVAWTTLAGQLMLTGDGGLTWRQVSF